MSDSPVLSVRSLHYRYEDGTAALGGVDFDLQEGESVALLGANGSGKTTFLLHLNGLLKGEGTVRIVGGQFRDAGVVFQDSDNQLFMPTVAEDVAFGPANLRWSAEEVRRATAEAMALVGISDLGGKAPFHLSAGEKKRAAIAGVLAMRPKILVLDEPTTFLDPPARTTLIQLLQRLPQAKVMATHDVPFAVAVASRAVFFEQGRIAGEGPVAQVAQRFGWL